MTDSVPVKIIEHLNSCAYCGRMLMCQCGRTNNHVCYFCKGGK